MITIEHFLSKTVIVFIHRAEPYLVCAKYRRFGDFDGNVENVSAAVVPFVLCLGLRCRTSCTELGQTSLHTTLIR